MSGDRRDKPNFSTMSVHAGESPDSGPVNPRAVPIYQTASFMFDSAEHARSLFSLEEEGDIYSRISNPTTAVFENRVAELEGGVGGLATASGMSAINLITFTLAESGDNVVSSANLYGGTYTYFTQSLPRYGIEARLVESDEPDEFARKIDGDTKFIHLETVSNPLLEVVDMERIADLAGEAKVPLVVDNTFATPYLCRPFAHGADIVWHSTTKWLNGHGTTIGGVVVDSGDFPWEEGKFPNLTEPDPSYHGVNFRERFGDAAFIANARARGQRDLGSSQGPFDSFLNLQGIATLPLRMDKHCENSLRIAEYLEDHPAVSWVRYPGLDSHPTHDLASRYLENGYGGVITFGVKGGYEAGKTVMESVELISFLANVGDAKSLLIHPSSTTHQQLGDEEKELAGITDDMLRFSVGIEDPEDIVDDLERGFGEV
ncbi:MAG: O-acetylhomoserine aminocarboxypropyltransferase/cysteine synthase family protein [Candidatus Bipolaricaulota bacterium]